MKKTAVRYIRPQSFFVFKHVIKVPKSKEMIKNNTHGLIRLFLKVHVLKFVFMKGKTKYNKKIKKWQQIIKHYSSNKLFHWILYIQGKCMQSITNI